MLQQNLDYDEKRYRALYEDDATIGGDQLLDKTQYGMEGETITNPTRYYLNFIEQIGIILKLAQMRGKRVLDIGCGDGIIASRKPGYASYVGLDISQKRLDRCTKLYGNERTEFKDVDVTHGLPFADASFDVVIASEIIEHVIDVPAFLSEIHRVLSPGGTLIISTPNVPTHIEFEDNLYKEQHLRLYSAKRLDHDVAKYGFKVKAVTGTGLQLPQHTLGRSKDFSLLDSYKVNLLFTNKPYVIWKMLFSGLDVTGAWLGGRFRNQTILKATKA